MNSELKMRSFIAYDIPDEIVSYSAKIKKKLKKAGVWGRWVKPENLHVTIAFLGKKTMEELLAYGSDIDGIGYDIKNISFTLTSLGTYGRPPNVLYLDMDDKNVRGAELVQYIQQVCGYEPDARAWTAHLTLARFKYPRQSRKLSKVDFEVLEKLRFSPSRIAIYISTLTETGPVYECVYSYK